MSLIYGYLEGEKLSLEEREKMKRIFTEVWVGENEKLVEDFIVKKRKRDVKAGEFRILCLDVKEKESSENEKSWTFVSDLLI
jgi:hypothetical protein